MQQPVSVNRVQTMCGANRVKKCDGLKERRFL
nr:MAG TPA: hypothetical protein [Caudoviricetes sp.]